MKEVERKALKSIMQLFHKAAVKKEWADEPAVKPRKVDRRRAEDKLSSIVGDVVAKKE